MPVCHKCGKNFSTTQALTYHLNKKYKCGTWKCTKCNSLFSTQFDLKIHCLSCNETQFNDIPSFDVLVAIYTSKSIVFYHQDEQDIIHSVSPSVLDIYGLPPKSFIGKKDSIICLGGKYFRTIHNGEQVEVTRKQLSDNIFIEFVL